MKNIKLSLIAAAIAMSFSLSACYSSGGGGKSVAIPAATDSSSGSSSENQNSGTTNNTNASDTSSNSSQNNASNSTSNGASSGAGNTETLKTTFQDALSNTLTSTDSHKINGFLVSVKNDGSFTGSNPAVNPERPYIDELVVDGNRVAILGFKHSEPYKLVEFSDADVKKPATLTNISGYAGSRGHNLDDYNFRALRYGVLKTANASHLFVQGYVTPLQTTQVNTQLGSEEYLALFTQGSFKYEEGNAIYGKDGNYTTSFATVTADFSNKKVKVEVKDDAKSAAKLTFGGEISGSTFQGERNNIETKGAFFGSQARDVGGVFNDKNTGNHGVFGASLRHTTAESLKDF